MRLLGQTVMNFEQMYIHDIVIIKNSLNELLHTTFRKIHDKPDNLMYIPNDDTQSYPFCRLKLVVETHST